MLKNSGLKGDLNYRPAQLCEGKEWYIWFYAMKDGKLKRVKRKLNYIKNKRTRRRYAEALIEKINADLRDGWNPFSSTSGGDNIISLFEAFESFERKKLRELEHDSRRTYISHIKMLREWMEKNKYSNLRAIDFSRRMALDYLEYVIDAKKVSARTVNNYKRVLSAIFGWFVDQEIITQNHFSNIKKLAAPQKKREPIPRPVLKEIHDYFEAHDPAMILCCYLLFYTELRPSEQTKLRVQDVDLKNQIIHVSPEIAKNKKYRYPTIPDVFLKYLETLNLDQYDPEYYLISENWHPGKKRLNPRYIARQWGEMRDKLQLPMKYQFYSLRDTGITHMLDAGILTHDVMKQSGHSDLSITTIYANHHRPAANIDIKKIPGMI